LALFALGAAALAPACNAIDWTFYIVEPASSSTGSTTTTTSGPLCTPGSTQSCYDGPAGTEGQGICKAGQQTCADDGASWGPCVGEVLPKPEDCATPEDENCDGQAPPCEGALLWAKRFGDGSDQYGAGVAADAAGNVIVVGSFNGSADFGGGALVSAGASDVFVVKLDPQGNYLWAKRFGDANDQTAESVAVDSAGNVIVVGEFRGTINFGGSPLTSAGGVDAFVVKLDPNGGHLWSKSFGDASGQAAQSVAIDAVGDVCITGYFGGTINFGGSTLTSSSSGDLFVAKLDPNGGHLWSKDFGGGPQGRQAIAVDASGDVFVTGYALGTLDFGGGPLDGDGTIFAAKLDPSGGYQWAKRFGDGSSGPQSGVGIAATGVGAVVLTGGFGGMLDFGGGTLPVGTGGGVYVAELDGSGGHLWSKAFGSAGSWGVASDSTNNVVLTGAMTGQTNFGGPPLPSAGGKDFFLAKLEGQHGDHKWSERFGDAQDQIAQSVAVDAPGNVLVAGYFAGTIDFGGGVQLVSKGGFDIFVAKFTQ
jgi:hypothetical protein